jgi:hypothetical protein
LSAPALAQSQSAVIEPDRPDLTNGVNTVAPGILQIEFGANFTRDGGKTDVGLPVTGRFGVTTRLELRVDATSVESDVAENVRSTGIGDIAAGAKFRLWYGRGGLPPSSIAPAINVRATRSHTGLMFGDLDYTLAWLTGFDVGPQAHVDLNYRIGAISAGRASPHFAQHLASMSVNVTPAETWAPYVELYWISREEPEAAATTAIDTGFIHTITPRLAIDAGVQIGVSQAASTFGFFAGVSTMIGHRRSTAAFRPAPDRD